MAIVVTPDFLSNGSTICTNNSTAYGLDIKYCPIVNSIHGGYLARNYTKLSPDQCISTYANWFLVGYRNLIAVMNTSSPDANYFLWPPDAFNNNNSDSTWPDTRQIPADMQVPTPYNDTTLLSIINPGPDGSSQWFCNYYSTEICTTQQAQSFGKSWKITPAEYPIQFCYSEVVPLSLCKLEYWSLLVVIVLCCNVIKTLCMAITMWKLWRIDNPLLATIGDATASFLEKPDQTTKGWCLMDRKSLKSWKKRKAVNNLYRPLKSLRFFRAASLMRWCCTLFLCLGVIATAFFLWSMTIGELSNVGFGSLNSNTLLSIIPPYKNAGTLGNVFIANSPQLVLSVSITGVPYAGRSLLSLDFNMNYIPAPSALTWKC